MLAFTKTKGKILFILCIPAITFEKHYMGWAAQCYGFKTPKVPVTFNKTKNCYDFCFSGTEEDAPENEEIEEYKDGNDVDGEAAKEK